MQQYMLLTREVYDEILEILLKKNKNGAHDEVIKLLEKASELVAMREKVNGELITLRDELMQTFGAMPTASPDQKKKLNEKVKKLASKINDLEKERVALSR